MVSLITGTDSIGLAACSETLYYETVEFYASLGFAETRSYTKEVGTEFDPAYCSDSLKEAWLMNFDELSDETITLKIRLVPSEEGTAASKKLNREDQDWRRHSGQLSFRCRNLQVQRQLRKKQ